MCSNFEVKLSIQQLEKTFGIKSVPAGMLDKPSQRPTDNTLVIGPNAGFAPLEWGLRVSWQKQPLINARSETLLEKTSFTECRNNRCIVPASAWFEWRADKGQKLKNRIWSQNQEVLLFGAIFSGQTVCILTCAAHDNISHIHHRMPLMVNPMQMDQWLNPDVKTHDIQDQLTTPSGINFTSLEDRPAQMDLF